MNTNSKLMDMLTGYAASHQHPFNVAIHMVGIPIIMLGVLIPLTWVSFDIGSLSVNLGQILVVGMCLFYLTLDVPFGLVFLVAGLLIAELAKVLGAYETQTAWLIAGGCFFGGYIAQFIGHAVEKSMPVLVKHPIQANLAAPFFTVVELFGFAGLRKELFDEVQKEVAARRAGET